MQSMTPSAHVLIILSIVVILVGMSSVYLVELPFCEGLTDAPIAAGREAG